MRPAVGIALLALWTLPACGAKTGLLIEDPDAGAGDAGDASDAAPDGRVLTPLRCETGDVVIEYGPGGEPSPAHADLEATIVANRSDVYFLFDTTSSMTGEIDAMREAVLRLIAAITCTVRSLRCTADDDCPAGERCNPDGRCAEAPEATGCLPDLRVGIGSFDGLPQSFRHLHDISPPSDATRLAIPDASGSGADEALFESVACVAGVGPCAGAGCVGTGRGCVGFRDGAVPVLVTITDEEDQCGLTGACTATEETAGDALRELGATFVGVDAEPDRAEATPDLEALAHAAGSVDTSGRPLVFGGDRDEVVEAVREGLRTVALAPRRLTVTLDPLGGGPSALELVDHVRVDTVSPGCTAFDRLEDRDRDGTADTVPFAESGTRGCFDVVARRFDRAPPDLPRRLRADLLASGAIADTVQVCFRAARSD